MTTYVCLFVDYICMYDYVISVLNVATLSFALHRAHIFVVD